LIAAMRPPARSASPSCCTPSPVIGASGPRAWAPRRARAKRNDERGVGDVKHNAVAGHGFISWAALKAPWAWWQRYISD